MEMAIDRFVLNHLRGLPIFARLSQEQLAQVAAACQVLRFEPGQIVFAQGQPTQGMFLFVSGRGVLNQRTPDGFDERIGTVEGGQSLNEAALYFEGRESASLHIVEQAIVLFLSRRRFAQLLRDHPALRANLRVPESAADMAANQLPLAATQAARPAVEPHRSAPAQLFKGQRDDETVLHIFRRHPWAFIRYIWLPILMVVVGIGAGLLLGAGTPPLALAIAGFSVLIGSLTFLYLYFEWRDDSIVLTDQRVVRIWNHLLRFERTINEIPLERVLEVTYEIPPADPFAQMFSYGTLHVRTAGEAANFELDVMPNPDRIQKLIFEQRDRFQEETAEKNRALIRDDLARALGLPVASADQPRKRQTEDNVRVETVGLPLLRTKFQNQSGDIYYRRHSTVWLAHVILPLIAIGAAVVIAVISLVPEMPLSGGVGLAAAFLVGLAGLIWLYMADWDWRNDVMILSDDTITLIHKRPLWLQNEVQRVRLGQVDNVVSDVTGVINNLLNRGTVRISLIGSNELKVFDNVYDPLAVQAEISRRQAAFKARQRTNEALQQRQTIADYLAVYHETLASGAGSVNPQQGGASTPPIPNAPAFYKPGTNNAPNSDTTQPTVPPTTSPAGGALPRFEPPVPPRAPTERDHTAGMTRAGRRRPPRIRPSDLPE